MIAKDVSVPNALTEARIAIRSPLLFGPIALAMLVFTAAGLSAPYAHLDLTAKIETSLLH